jgi:hypothetical protein
VLGRSLGMLERSADMLVAKLGTPTPINPVCYTRDATKLLVQFDVQWIVAGVQHKHTSIYILEGLRAECTRMKQQDGTTRRKHLDGTLENP